MKKILKTLILLILISLILSIFNCSVFASSISADINSINDSRYPGIKSAIQELKNSHPNWEFKIYYTGLDWAEVVMNEFSGHREYAKNQVSIGGNYSGDWVCPVCRDYCKSSWSHASIPAIQYMLDPRNSIDGTSVFQFEELTNSGYDINVIIAMTNGTFLEGHAYEVADAANQTGVNPYYILSKIYQEQGTGGSVLANGTYGYYNPFNIGAAGSTSAEDISNGVAYAQRQGWDTLTKGIVGGVGFIKRNYIDRGQNTIYFQKFDVSDDDDSLYSNQYMQNILGAENEGRTMRSYYISSGTYESKHTFIIPVYENMPATKVSRPSTSDTAANVIQITTQPVVKQYRVSSSNKLRLRNSPIGDTIDWLVNGQIVTIVEKATSKVNGTYWDKIKTEGGTTGYAARETYEYEMIYRKYLIEIN